MGLKQDVIELKAQVRIWERERIEQDKIITQLQKDLTDVITQLHQTTIICNQISKDYAALRAATSPQSGRPDHDGSPES